MNGVITEKYLWKDAITLLAVYDGSNNLKIRFNHADGRMPASMTIAGVTYYLAYDQVGSLRAVTDTTGNIIKQIDYDSFGNIISDSNPTFTVPFGFAGGLHDRDTGLVRFSARDYDPAIGRWTAKDPIGFAGGDLNLFNYVEADPINWTDILGLSRDKYVPDRDKHGAPHIDRYTPEGKNVGRYRPDGTLIEHGGKCPPPIPKKDMSKFLKAAKKLGWIGLVITGLNLGFDIYESGAQQAIGNAIGETLDNIVNPFFGADEAW